jgi:phenylacetate-CoA ligase
VGYQQYWNEARETRPAADRDAASLAQLQKQLQRAYREMPFYRRHWDAHGFHPDQVRTFEDFTERCPVITKKMLVADQADHPPYGSYLGVDPTDIARVHGSSGTSGTPTIYGVAERDWHDAGEAFAMTQWAMGVRPGDLVQFAFPFSLFFGGWGVLYGAEQIGAACFPIGLNDTKRHIQLMYQLSSTVIEGTPSYLLHMAEVATEMGYDPADSPLRRAIVGGEPGGSIPSTRQRILGTWGLETVCDSGSTSEMFPFCTNTECTEMNGPHLYTDQVWTEIVDPDDANRSLPEGEIGSIVYTHLWRVSQPMIRFAPGDRSFMSHEPCPCGRTYPRLPMGVLGRSDDVLVIRGANVYPSAIEHGLREVDGLGLEFRIRVSRRGSLDEILVEAERAEEQPLTEGDRETVRRRAEEQLKTHCHIRVPVQIVEPGTFDRTTLKARRVIDERPSLV